MRVKLKTLTALIALLTIVYAGAGNPQTCAESTDNSIYFAYVSSGILIGDVIGLGFYFFDMQHPDLNILECNAGFFKGFFIPLVFFISSLFIWLFFFRYALRGFRRYDFNRRELYVDGLISMLLSSVLVWISLGIFYTTASFLPFICITRPTGHLLVIILLSAMTGPIIASIRYKKRLNLDRTPVVEFHVMIYFSTIMIRFILFGLLCMLC